MESVEKTTNRSDAVERLHEQLQHSLGELVTSEDWQRALAVAARFHDYSFANTRLTCAQSLARGFTPSRIAGYRAWQELGPHPSTGCRYRPDEHPHWHPDNTRMTGRFETIG